MNNTISVLVIEDHDCVSKSIIDILQGSKDIIFNTDMAGYVDEALSKIRKNSPDIIFLDLILKNPPALSNFTGGDELLRELNKFQNRPKVIVLSKVDSLDMLDYIINILNADGYILKSRTSLEEIIPAAKQVLENENYFSPQVKKILQHNENLLEVDFVDVFIIKKLSQGFIQPEIETALLDRNVQLTVSAIEKRIRRLKIRFDAKTTTHLIALALQNGII
jgi:DNA-binding NarL/FixJ family response regulator